MRRNRLAIGLGFLAATMIVVGCGPRPAYTPINLMGSNPTAPIVVTTLPTPTTAVVDGNNAQPNTLVSAISQSDQGVTYTVQAGDTLYRIALQFGLTAEGVAAANGMSDPTQIYEGQTLIIPIQPGQLPTVIAAVPTSAAPTFSGTPINLADLPPPPSDVNGIPLDSIAVMPQGVIDHIRNIYSIGQSLGRNPHALSKLGDSTIENPHFLTRFDTGPYNLGDYGYLQGVINYYVGSFSRDSAVHRGLHTWSVFDPMWAGGGCQPGEDMLVCEMRLENPSVLIIHLGSNDGGVPDSTRKNFQKIVEFCMENGVIPILGTKADRHEGSNINNEIIRQIAYDYNLPLWDFDAVASTLPGKGLDQDGTHMTAFFAHDWSSPIAFQRGYGLMNLTALIALDKVWRAVVPPS
ncbi:MAG: LysM peptidoglycan-binding domain-containing protein [Chloroflexota bacterium]